uniref:RING-type domain-containing protein n=1 Tax=Dunaliella tertiolecta TaxID=3047 RepID=A0A7S3QMI0_DUNTE|mmetsp:Transcript_4810/g.11375  ORF Transcript_4810/g.11375 Transcript_4810/m.11375 type:complete len:366 (-) Transcript_4810:244-1341(-)
MAPNATASGLVIHAADRLNASNGAGISHHNSSMVHPEHGIHPDGTVPPNPALAVLLVYGILFLMVGAQAALFLWRKKHQRSYDLVTLIGLWLMPPMLCVQLKFWRFIVVWLLYSTVTAYLLSLCARPRLELSTPRRVYSWFLGVYKASKLIGVVGYLMVLVEMLGGSVLLRLLFPPGFWLDLIWYGVYFGVLGRDCAEVASDRMASSMGNQGRRLVSTVNNCGICNNELKDFSHLGDQQDGNERVVQLSCKHCFHDQCVRGWTMVGKKDTCPCCNEKVDLRSLYSDRPWETRNLTWIQMLDTVRYLVVWNPLIFMAFSFAFHFLAPPSVLPHGHDAHVDALHELGHANNATHHLMPPPMNGTALH